jgi:hypothetical protein
MERGRQDHRKVEAVIGLTYYVLHMHGWNKRLLNGNNQIRAAFPCLLAVRT